MSSETTTTLALLNALDSTRSTLRSSLKTLSTSATSPDPSDANASSSTPAATTPNPQKSLADALNVLEAQYTKLTLVLTNPPLSHGGIKEVVTDLTVRVLPAIFSSAAYIVGRKDVWGKLYAQAIAVKINAVFATVESFDEVMREQIKTRDGQDSKGKTRAKKEEEKEKEAMYVMAGKVFDICKTTAKFAMDGVAKCLLDRTKAAVELLHDALEEVRDWSEDVDEDSVSGGDEDDDDADSEAEDVGARVAGLTIGDQDVDDVRKLPAHRSDLRDLLSETKRRVDLIAKLYLAASKRRIKKFPDPKLSLGPDGNADEKHVRNMKRLDDVVDKVESSSEEMDELAHGFYQLDEREVEQRLLRMTSLAKEVAENVKTDWERSDDDFSVWVGKWQVLIDKKQSVSSVASSSV